MKYFLYADMGGSYFKAEADTLDETKTIIIDWIIESICPIKAIKILLVSDEQMKMSTNDILRLGKQINFGVDIKIHFKE